MNGPLGSIFEKCGRARMLYLTVLPPANNSVLHLSEMFASWHSYFFSLCLVDEIMSVKSHCLGTQLNELDNAGGIGANPLPYDHESDLNSLGLASTETT